MKALYVTSDQIGTPTGGGKVTYHESKALQQFALNDLNVGIEFWSRKLLGEQRSVWSDDEHGKYAVVGDYAIAHFYAGTWTETIKELKRRGVKVTYTAAAHSVEESKREHEALGIPFDYPHLTDPDQWQRYLEGYKLADVLICPSSHSADTMRSFGCTNRIEVIPHGYDLPQGKYRPPNPRKFTIGYLGAVGPDKGLRYLLEAWKLLNYQDDSLLAVYGSQSNSDYTHALANRFAPGTNRYLGGWVENISDFYSNIDVYVQPSVTEGFGIEVLEAMAHGTPVVCSNGAGAVDLIARHNCGLRFAPRDVIGLAAMIDFYKKHPTKATDHGYTGWKAAGYYTWTKVKEQYVQVWKELLA